MTSPRASAIRASQHPTQPRDEIVAKFLSANSPETGSINDGLRRCLWDAEHRGLPDGIRVLVGLRTRVLNKDEVPIPAK